MRSPLARATAWLVRRPRRTVRLRLTALYGGLFLVSGAALLAVTYLLVGSFVKWPGQVRVTTGPNHAVTITTPYATRTVHHLSQAQLRQGLAVREEVVRQHQADLHQLLMESGIALGIMAVVSVGLGWLVAGRALRPLRQITAAAQDISATSLDRRLSLEGPDDELKELGDTFDGLLGRLESVFSAQRQFVANASHELRSPLTRQRTLIEVALSDPEPTVESLRASYQRVLAAGEQQERLIDELLTLARGERGLERREPVNLAAVTTKVLGAVREEAHERGLSVDAALASTPISGNARLVERLVVNLVNNAIRYNRAGGHIEVVTKMDPSGPMVVVSNSGPTIRSSEVDRLFRPFQRLDHDRTGHGEGHGLGLSIVRTIAAAHDASVTAHPRSEGGLCVTVVFPAAAAEVVDQSAAATTLAPAPPVQGLARTERLASSNT